MDRHNVRMAKSRSKKTVRQAASSKISHDVREVISHAEELLQATAGELGDKAREVRQQLAHKIEAAKEKFQSFEDVKEAAEEGMKDHRLPIERKAEA